MAHFTVTRDSIKQSYYPPQRFFLTNVTVSPMAQAVNDSIIMKNGRLTSSTVAAAIKLKDANQRLRQQTTSTQRSSFL
jgi:CCR4-NOT transcriptional regulation complex NOT5 subunit